MPPKAKSAPKKRPAKGPMPALAAPLPVGEVVTDVLKKPWKIGKSIGSGGFGLIYLAAPANDGAITSDASYVMKVEPHANGPLFTELAFYHRCCKAETMAAWKTAHKLKYLAAPIYVASGQHEKNGQKLRFMVMERYGTDLQKVFVQNGNRFSVATVYTLGLRMLEALHYIHDQSYVHADIKAANILQGFRKPEQICLVDFGLVCRYRGLDKVHKEYKEDPRLKHDGTIEVTSRDAHRGVAPSRRSDLEILGYCMLQWLCGALPWETNLADKEKVAASKEKHMKDVKGLLKLCGCTEQVELRSFLEQVAALRYEQEPPYAAFAALFKKALKRVGAPLQGALDFSSTKAVTAQKTKARKRISTSSTENLSDEAAPVVKVKKEAVKVEVKKERTRTAAKSKAARTGAQNPAESNGVYRSSRGSDSAASGRMKSCSDDESPASGPAAKRSRASPRVLSPRNVIPTEAYISPIVQRQRKVSPQVKVARSKVSRAKRIKKETASACTQTSPGLKGLPRSWKKTRSSSKRPDI